MNQKDKNTIDKLHQYISGSLPSKEMEAIQNEISSNPYLQQEYEVALREHLVIKEQAKQELKKKAQTLLKKTRLNTNAQRIRLRQWQRIAASLLILIGLFFVWQRYNQVQDPSTLFASYYERPQPSYPRSNTTNQQAIINQAIQAYQSENFQEAFNHFDQLEDVRNDSIDIGALKLFKGISLIELNNYNMATIELDGVPPESSFFAEAQWLSALISLKENKLEMAKTKFNIIASQGGYKQKESAEIIKYLDNQ